MANITITITCLPSHKTDSIEVSLGTTLSELCGYAVAILGISDSDSLVLSKDGTRLYTHAAGNSGANMGSNSNLTLSDAGVKNGDLIVVTVTQPNDSAAPRPAPTRSTANASNAGNLGGLDFSSLLAASSSAPAATTSSSSSSNLHFNLPMLSSLQTHQTTPVEWDGMSLDDAAHRNPNPDCFVQVILNETKHPNLLKELNYHNPILAKNLQEAGGLNQASAIWRQEMQKSTLSSTITKTLEKNKELEMERRLRLNPMDQEANAYFGDNIRKQNVEEQYRQMMEQFPESMGRVLMLYIDVKLNNHPIQAFVDSGAQSTIMSSKCAEQCGILHLLDTRFSGTAVGVGTGKILGRIHLAQMQVDNHYFPCTITIMDSEEGLGDKNMDFLLGLDMLKRHRCNIDLAKDALLFRVGDTILESPFLHEKDLTEQKGGTKGFDAEKNNKDLEKMQEE